ncbi:MAG: hypothetical protein FWE23_05990 [Chitinivibrionia bacterium]|nr:hypothetical protein [Chitinivibrionia bacterium]
MEYVLSWQATVAIFAVVMVVMWFLGAIFKCPRPLAILIAAGIAVAVKHYWWFIDAKLKDWARFMGLDV